MLFNIESDNGASIDGYLVPDSFSEHPHIIVFSQGAEIYRGPCDSMREGVLNNGRHQTGMVGFHLDENLIPGLSYITDLEILDLTTGFLIYRRSSNPNLIEKKIFRLETQFVPKTLLDKSLKDHFRCSFLQIDNYGLETATQIFHLEDYSSLYMSGRILLKNYEMFLDSDLMVITSINDPYEEFALRLLSISQYKKKQLRFLSERDQLNYSPAIDYFDTLDIHDEKNVTRLIKQAPKEILEIFQSPVTRQLVTKTPEEKVSYRSVATALDMLSRFKITNLAGRGAPMAETLGELLEIPAIYINTDQNIQFVRTFADILRNITTLDTLLDSDLILYHYVKDAIHQE